MTTSKDLSHLNFLAFSSRGYRYLRAYKNEWVSKKVTKQDKGRSRTKEQYHAGTLLDGHRVRLSPKFLAAFPQFAGYEWFYEDNLLKDRETYLLDHPECADALAGTENDLLPDLESDRPAVQPSENRESVDGKDSQDEQLPLPTTLSFLPAYAVMAMARDQGYERALAAVFDPKMAKDWMLAIAYRILDSGPAQSISDWLEEQYLGTRGGILTGQRLSELYARCSQEKFDQFWVERFKRSQQTSRSLNGSHPIRYCAFDSTSISSYSTTIDDCAFGHAKQDSELPQINLAVVMDQVTGELLYAHVYEGSINDKATYPFVFEKMVQAGFPMQEIVLVTDRGYPSNYGLNNVLAEGAHFLSACPILKDSSLEKWIIGHVDLMEMPTVWDPVLNLGTFTTTEKWKADKVEKTVYVHYFYDATAAAEIRSDFNSKITTALGLLNAGQKIDDSLMKAVKPFIKKVPKPDCNPHMKPEMHWVIVDAEVKRFFSRAGFFVLKSDCFENAREAHQLYVMRSRIEQGFDQLKHSIDGRRLRVTARSYRGRLLEYLIATSMRCQILHRRDEYRKSNPDSKLKIPGDSLDKMFRQLDRFKIRRQQSNRRWQLDLLPAKVVKWLDVFFHVKTPPRSFW